jgi:S1-C subfamily serine protease
LLLFLVLLGMLAWRYGPSLFKRDGPLHDPGAQLREATQRGPLQPDEQQTIGVFERSWPGVVFITPVDMHLDWRTGAVREVPRGTGSGFVWDTKGNIVTNFHVIQATNGRPGEVVAKVLVPGISEPLNAVLVGRDPNHDIAVIRVDAPEDKLKPLPIGSSADLKVGQKVLAIGNPFGLNGTLTTGVISALNRSIQSVTDRPIEGVIQTDAAINPGNSGGPLLDSEGLVIGVNTAIYSPSGAYAGIGFAIPIDTVNKVVTRLIAGAGPEVVASSRPRLGVILWGPEEARELGVDAGLLVRAIIPGAAADKAGLRPTQFDSRGRVRLGDIIIGLDGQPLTAIQDLQRQLEKYPVGSTVKVTIFRDGQRMEVPVTLQAG